MVDVIEVVDPATEQVVGSVPAGTPQDVDAAVTDAARAFGAWSTTPPLERSAVLHAWHARLAERADELSALVTRELGAPAPVAARVHVGLPLRTLAFHAELLETYAFEQTVGPSLVVRVPVGVVGAVTPWNYPLHQVMAKVAPALAAGCTVVLKPSELAPLAVEEALVEAYAAGLPDGALRVVHGTGPVAGSALVADPRLDFVSFTGSVATGRAVASAAGAVGTRVVLELGGKSANVVLPDVDDALLARAVRTGVGRCMLNTGQTCTAWTRLLVPRDRYDDAVELAAAEAIGYAPGRRLGPLVSADQRDRVRGYVARAVADGAGIATGGIEPPDGMDVGYWFRPTVLADVRPDSEIAQDEVFGPVLIVQAYDDEEQALALAEGTGYGLAAGVWSADLDRAVAFGKRMRVGQVDVNGAPFNPLAPFGGFKSSGFGRELGPHGFEEFLTTQSLQL